MTNTHTLEEIFNETCVILEFHPDQIKTKSRKKQYVIVRSIFCYVCCFYTNYSLKEIGWFLNGRDHTTVMSNRENAREFIKTKDKDFMERWDVYTSQSEIYKQLKSQKHA
jgi:chromosomal replication initiation ATPase DnaA